jgi:hypothetical protein
MRSTFAHQLGNTSFNGPKRSMVVIVSATSGLDAMHAVPKLWRDR